MSDRCHDQKARACRRCAASPLDAALAIVREGADTQHTTSLTWQESRALLDHLEKSAEWERAANRHAANFEAEYERAEQAVAARQQAEAEREEARRDLRSMTRRRDEEAKRADGNWATLNRIANRSEADLADMTRQRDEAEQRWDVEAREARVTERELADLRARIEALADAWGLYAAMTDETDTGGKTAAVIRRTSAADLRAALSPTDPTANTTTTKEI